MPGSSELSPGDGDDRYEAFVQVFARHEADLRRFIRSLVPTRVDADEVVQQAALVLWRKFEDYDRETDFMKWACVVARFEALAYRRKMARDRLVFREDVFDLLASEGVEEAEERQAEQNALEECLGTMSEKQRHFVTLAYTPGVKVKELAAQAESTAAAFYMRLKRLRRQLMSCVESKLSLEGPSS